MPDQRVVVVSNRLPSIGDGKAGARAKPVGGLASAILSFLEFKKEPCLWFGWSGKVAPVKKRAITTMEKGAIKIVGIDYSENELDDFYNGFCNRALWPLFHCFQARIKLKPSEYKVYLKVNQRLAESLMPLITKDDLVWIHDYQLAPMGNFLRKAGFDGALGFFLHIPFPPLEFWQILPNYEELLKMMLAYNLVGFQTKSHLDNYIYAQERIFGAVQKDNLLEAKNQRQWASAYPIGIDPDRFLKASQAERRKGENLERIARRRKIILGVDRLDYTKGIDMRILGFHRFLELYPHWRGKVSFIQIAPPSRTHIAEYLEMKKRIDSLVGELNGEFAEYDWTPVRFLYRSYGYEQLAKFYHQADVCLVTSLRDGMNLVAKEFVACQNPADPGVLVLSRFAGASEELDKAVIINPYSPEDIAKGIYTALTMKSKEKKARHQSLFKKVQENSIYNWGTRFIQDLKTAYSLPDSNLNP